MQVSTISFIGWAVLMVIAIIGLAITGRRSRSSQHKMEDVAAEALPVIGKIAEKQHIKSFGRPAEDAPGEDGSWYPEAKKKFARHA